MKNTTLYLLIAIIYWVMIVACLPFPYNSAVVTTFKPMFITITNFTWTKDQNLIDTNTHEGNFTDGVEKTSTINLTATAH